MLTREHIHPGERSKEGRTCRLCLTTSIYGLGLTALVVQKDNYFSYWFSKDFILVVMLFWCGAAKRADTHICLWEKQKQGNAWASNMVLPCKKNKLIMLDNFSHQQAISNLEKRKWGFCVPGISTPLLDKIVTSDDVHLVQK